MKKLLAVAAILASSTPSTSLAQELRIGFLTTLTGAGAQIGQQMLNGFRLGLEHEGWNKDGDLLAGAPTRVFVSDDRFQVDVAVKEIDALITRQRVQIIAGWAWSNIAIAGRPLMLNNKVVQFSNIAGTSLLAGKQCHQYFVSSSFLADQYAEALGQVLNGDRIETVYALAPNYQAGKDMIAGFKRTYKGKVVEQSLYKLNESDFQPEISKLRAAKPAAAFFFGPGPMGVAFFKQWAASGIGAEIKLYTVAALDNLSLPTIGEAALGGVHASWWDASSTRPENENFKKSYLAQHGVLPAEYALAPYDGARMIAVATKAMGGKIDDTLALAKALRKAKVTSPRGSLTIAENGFPVQNWFKREVVRNAKGNLEIVTRQQVVETARDSFINECPPELRH